MTNTTNIQTPISNNLNLKTFLILIIGHSPFGHWILEFGNIGYSPENHYAQASTCVY